jgi:hypothetical protein
MSWTSEAPFASRALAAILAASVLGAAPHANAARVEPPSEEARRLYDEGRARFETLDYRGAIDLWTQAYAMVPSTDDNHVIRTNLVYNIAAAQEKWFDLDGDVTHLRQARGLLERYLDGYKKVHAPTPAARAEVEQVNKRLSQIDARIQASQAVPGAGTPAPATAPVPAPVVDPRVEERQRAREEKIEARRLLSEDPEIAPLYRSGRGMLSGGIALLVVGGISTLVGAGFAVSDFGVSDAAVRRNHVVGYSLLALGVGMLGGGAALVGIGATRKKKAQRQAQEKASLSFLPAPSLGGGSGTFVLRF